MNISHSLEEETFCGLEPHDYLEVKFFLTSVIGSLVGLFGIFGNVSTVLILTRPSMRNPNNLFLTALAIFDSCLLVTAFFIYGMEYIIEYAKAFDLYVAWLTYLRFAFALSHISQTGSVYTTVSVTVERYMAVCYPKSSKKYCTSRGSALSVLCVTCFSIIFNSTKFFELEISRNPVCGEGSDWQSFLLLPSRLARNPLYGQIYALWLTNLVMVFFPFLTLLVLNSIIAYTIRKSLQKVRCNQRFHSHSVLKEKSREATLVLVVIVCIFLLCNVWGFVLTLLEQILDRRWLEVEHHVFYTFSREAINLLAIINSSINFAIYIIFGKDFRKELVVIYGCGIRGVTLRLPTQDKFRIWSHISRRRNTLLTMHKSTSLRNGFRAVNFASLTTNRDCSAMTLNAATSVSELDEAELQKSMASNRASLKQDGNKITVNVKKTFRISSPAYESYCARNLSVQIPLHYEQRHLSETAKQRLGESTKSSSLTFLRDSGFQTTKSNSSIVAVDKINRHNSLETTAQFVNHSTLGTMTNGGIVDEEEDEILILGALDQNTFNEELKSWTKEQKQPQLSLNSCENFI